MGPLHRIKPLSAVLQTPHVLRGFREFPLDLTLAVNRLIWPNFRQILSLFLRAFGLQDCQAQAIIFRFPCGSTIYAWTRKGVFLASMLIRQDANDLRRNPSDIAFPRNAR